MQEDIAYKKLDEYLNSLNFVDKNYMKWCIIKECGISGLIYWNWRTGKTKIPPMAKAKIEKLAGRRIFN